jgi:meso-butanediol dehydrogenase/(S,S)-butanediol dehydrogenase/diacetyl reductase
MEEQHRFKGKVVLVTGASRGIGEAIALRFAREGADVVLSADEERVKEVAEQASEYGSKALPIIMDVKDKEQVVNLFARAMSEFGRIDVSVHNAGIISVARVSDLTEEEWDRVLAVNTKGIFLCCQAAAEHMQKQGFGRIINAASGQAKQGRIFTPHYAASKAGVIGLTQSLALELAPYGITVNAYCPGIIQTDMWDYNDRKWGKLLGGYAPGEYVRELIDRVPLKRAGTPEEVAGLVAFLASDDAGYITGQSININGGSFMS